MRGRTRRTSLLRRRDRRGRFLAWNRRRRFLHRRKNRPVFVIDIAVPRDVDPAVNRLEGSSCTTIDDLQSWRLRHQVVGARGRRRR